MTQKKRSLMERLDQDNAVICAEGFLFEMERRGYLTSGEFVPEVAMTAGKTPKSARFAEKMENHFMYGSNERLPEHITTYGDKA